MRPTQTIKLSILALATGIAASAQAQSLVYKTNNNDSLELSTSWTNGVAPTVLDTAIWDFNVGTAANCTNTLSGSLTWNGIQILNPAAPVQVRSSSTLSIGTNGIDLNEATTSRDLWLGLSLNTTADQNWAIAAGRALTVGDAGRNVNIQNNVAVNGHLYNYTNINIQSGGTLLITNSATIIEPSPGAPAQTRTPLIVANNTTGTNSVVQMAGTVKLKRTDGTSGSPQPIITIGGANSGSIGVYTITGGSLLDTSATTTTFTNTATVNVGNGSSSFGTLNVDSNALVQVGSIRLANAATATGTMNVTNGTVIVTGGTFDVGRTTSATPLAGTLNVYGGSVSSFAGMDVPHGNGPGFVNIYGGNVFVNSMNVAASGAAIGNGIVTISGGSLTVTNSITLPAGANGTGTILLNSGGTLIVGSIARSGTVNGTIFFNGGTLKPRNSSVNFITNTVTASVTNGGAVIDTANVNITIPAALVNGNGGTDGGLTKVGAGTLTLAGADTYTGPTMVGAGTLAVTTTNHPGGAITVSNAATLHVTLAAAGTTLNCSSLALGTLPLGSGTNTAEFDFNGFANPAIPVIYSTNLMAAGTVLVNVFGSGFGIGTYHLIQYNGSVGGGSYAFVLNSVSGAVGFVTNNATTHFVDLVITALPDLVWRALVNTNWDINTTANWVDLSSLQPVTYPNGATTLFDDSTSNALVFATTVVSPASVTVSNSVRNYTFTGVGRISGTAGLTKVGPGTVTVGLSNDYTGNTIISNGIFRLGTNNVIPDGLGKGNVVLEGKLDLAGFSDAINSLNGNNGVIDNSGASAAVFTVGNGSGANGLFAGLITNSGSSLTLNKSGGTLVLLAQNGYSGGTTNGGGELQLASVRSIGTGPLTLNGGTLDWTDTLPHILTNKVMVGGSITLGQVTNGLLTIPATVDFRAGGHGVTCNSDVLWPAGMTNGALTSKNGPAMLTFQNGTGDWTSGSLGINGGTLVLDNSTILQDNNNIRIQCTTDNTLARLFVTNGASLTMTNGPTSNFRFVDSPNAGTDATNILDLAGTLVLTPYPGTSNNKFQMGSSTDPTGQNIVNLLPGGLLVVRQVLDLSPSSSSTFNFNGGTLRPSTNDLAATFMQGLDYAYVLDGGAFVDSAGYNITIGQPLLAGGSGGLTKNGLGKLTLGASEGYTGDTVINAGTLALGGSVASSNFIVGAGATLDVTAASLTLASGQTLKGNGMVLGSVSVSAGGTIAPGTSIGTLTMDTAPDLSGGGTLAMEINKSGVVLTSDLLVITNGNSLNYDGGILTVIASGNGLTGGEVFTLFNATAYTGSITSSNLPALSTGLSWDLSGLLIDGSIKVAGAVQIPSFNSATLSGTNLILRGSGGPLSGSYHLLATTNLTQSLSTWPSLGTFSFAADGKFTNSVPITPAIPQRFFAVQVQ